MLVSHLDAITDLLVVSGGKKRAFFPLRNGLYPFNIQYGLLIFE